VVREEFLIGQVVAQASAPASKSQLTVIRLNTVKIEKMMSNKHFSCYSSVIAFHEVESILSGTD
jgi:hypothetical protein